MLAAITGRTGRLIFAALLGASILAGVYVAGARHGHQAAEIQRLEQREKTRKDVGMIENETRNISDDDLIDWLSRPVRMFTDR